MKHKFKKIVFLMTAGLLVFLGGCSSESNSNDSDSSVAEENNETETESVTVTVGTNAQYSPWIYTDEDTGEVVGVEVEILNEAMSRMDGDYELEFNITDFDGMFAALDAGQNDTIAQQISITPEREEKYMFSSHYAYNPLKLVVREEDADEVQTLEDLKGKTIMTGANGIDNQIVSAYKEKNDPNDEIDLQISNSDVLLAVATGQADAWVGAESYVLNYIEETGSELVTVGNPLYVEVNAYPFTSNVDEGFLDEFSQAIDSMHEDGFLSGLFNETFGVDLSEDVRSQVDDNLLE